MNEKQTSKNKMISLFLALLILTGMFQVLLPTMNVEAATVTRSHSTGSYHLNIEAYQYTPEVRFNFTQQTYDRLATIYGPAIVWSYPLAGQPAGSRTSNFLTMEGDYAVCANPAVIAGTTYTNKTTLSSAQLNAGNFEEFMNSYKDLRYPSQARSYISAYSDDNLSLAGWYTYISGLLGHSVPKADSDRLIAMWQEETGIADPYNFVALNLRTGENTTFWSWFYSLDGYIARSSGGGISYTWSQEKFNTIQSFYSFVRTLILQGELVINNPRISAYYTPGSANTNALYSNLQVIHSFGGMLTFQEKGLLKLVKQSAKPEYTANNNNYSLAGAEYGVFKDPARQTRVDSLITDSNGNSNVLEGLASGTYYIIEEKAPKGFIKDPRVQTVRVKPGETAVVTSVEMPIDDPVDIILQKVDVTTGLASPQGDGSLAGAEFTLSFYAGDYADGIDPAKQGISPSRTWVLRTQDDGRITLDNNFLIDEISDGFYLNPAGMPTLPLGTLTIQETKASEGYLLDDRVYIRKITQDGDLDRVTSYNVPIVNEQVILGDFSIFKGNADQEKAGIITPELGAEFVAIARKYIDQYGTFDEAMNHLADYGENEYSILLTDSDGNARSGKLAYGDYLIKQTKGQADLHLIKDLLPLTISEEGQTKHFNLNNPRIEYLVRIVKKDSVTGEHVILNSASFMLKDMATNDYVSMKVGTKTYNVFKTTAEHSGDIPAGTFYLDTEEAGTTVTPLTLKTGRYQVEEVETPAGYYLLEEPIELVVSQETVSEIDQDLDEIIELVVENRPQYGKLTINKVGEHFDSWTIKNVSLPIQNKGVTEQTQVEVARANEALTLTRNWTETKDIEELVTIIPAEIIPGKEAILDPQTGKEIEPAIPEKVVPAVEELVVKTVEEPQATSETVYTDATGNFSQDLTLKGKYTLTDKSGNVVASTSIQEGQVDTISVTLPSEIRIDESYTSGELIDRTFSYNKASYKVDFLAGVEFELRAKEDIKSYDGITTFYKKGDNVLLAQKDIMLAGEVLYEEGDVITIPVLDPAILADQTLVDSKITTKAEGLVLSKIPLGVYELAEVKAPAGYILDKMIRTFEFTPQEKTILVDMKETEPIENNRQKLNLSLVKAIDSTPYFKDLDFAGIVIGVYTNEIIDGLPKNSLVGVAKPTEAGVLTFNDLPAGNLYFKEISTKDGYILNTNEYTISIQADDIATSQDKVEILDGPIVNVPLTKDVKILKVDRDSGRPLVGVEFNVFKLEADGTKTPIKHLPTDSYSFFTDSSGEILIAGLPYGTYSLEEVKTIDGYIKDDQSYSVAVSEDSELELVVPNKVTTIGFRKIDSKTGLPITGATLKLVDNQGNDIYLDNLGYVTSQENGTLAMWVTDGNLFYVKGLSIDHGYKVVEVKAPEGYYKGDDLNFLVGGNTGIQLTDYPNVPYEPNIKTNAFNKDTGGKEAHAISKTHIADIISYTDLIPGREYKAKASLVLSTDPSIVIAKGELVFTPEAKDGQVEVNFGLVDLRDLSGQDTVIFESVIDLTTNLVVAIHRDKSDPKQTISVRKPEIGTQAKSKNGQDNVVAGTNTIIIDTVSYTGLIVGEEYTVKGVLMDKESGKPLLIKDKEIRSELTFIAENKDGEVELTFIFDSIGLGGKDLVVFEGIYYKDELIGEHKDINDKGQTIHIVEAEKPITNDETVNPTFFLTAGLAILLLAGFVLVKTRENKKNTRI